MTQFIYDTEVFRYDWFAIFKERGKDNWFIFHNDRELLVEFLNEHRDDLFIGFNSKAYDQYIGKGIVGDLDNETLKELSDYIVQDHQGFTFPALDDIRWRMNNVDIRDDMQQGLSLKAIEAHLMMDIQETEVDFNLDRPLTDEEAAMTVRYCRHDVEATERIVELRQGYLESKIAVGKLAGLTPEAALSMTNAKLTAAMLGARPRTYTDEREYKVPDNLLKEYVPQEVFDFFARMKDTSLSDEEVFKSKLSLKIGGCPVTIAYGGIHGAIPNFMWEEQGNDLIRNYDVASYYPSLMIKNGYVSRSIPSAQKFIDTYHTRIAAKKSGDKATANALKLVLNTTYGATLNRYNALYDPLMARSVCVSGQLYLTELATHLVAKIPGLSIVQLNTDGIMMRFNGVHYDSVQIIVNEWQERTGFGLEEDVIVGIWQKDVNNYVMRTSDGHEKAKGGYVVRGIAPAGAFNINNQAVIVAESIKDYFLNGTPVADTINACDDISKFQLIAKAGAKYKDAAWEYGGKKYPVQKVNRVYASNDPLAGRITKVKIADDSEALIASMPEHSVIDNRATLSIKDIDKSWYIALAEKRINDFKGIKPGKKDTMAAEKKTLNAFGRLLEARLKFLEAHVDKSGKHMQMKFKYFELDDIVPVATRIMKECGIISVVTIDENNASLSIVNVDDPSDMVVFTIPFTKWEGNSGVNPLQAMGASLTYYRRYLYMVAMDICEPDEIDGTHALPQPDSKPAPEAPKAEEKKAPATPAQREQTKIALAAADGPATELQIQQLKEGLRKLRAEKPESNQYVSLLAMETKGFTSITKSRCEELMKEVGAKLNG